MPRRRTPRRRRRACGGGRRRQANHAARNGSTRTAMFRKTSSGSPARSSVAFTAMPAPTPSRSATASPLARRANGTVPFGASAPSASDESWSTSCFQSRPECSAAYSRELVHAAEALDRDEERLVVGEPCGHEGVDTIAEMRFEFVDVANAEGVAALHPVAPRRDELVEGGGILGRHRSAQTECQPWLPVIGATGPDLIEHPADDRHCRRWSASVDAPCALRR